MTLPLLRGRMWPSGRGCVWCAWPSSRGCMWCACDLKHSVSSVQAWLINEHSFAAAAANERRYHNASFFVAEAGMLTWIDEAAERCVDAAGVCLEGDGGTVMQKPRRLRGSKCIVYLCQMMMNNNKDEEDRSDYGQVWRVRVPRCYGVRVDLCVYVCVHVELRIPNMWEYVCVNVWKGFEKIWIQFFFVG